MVREYFFGGVGTGASWGSLMLATQVLCHFKLFPDTFDLVLRQDLTNFAQAGLRLLIPASTSLIIEGSPHLAGRKFLKFNIATL
jgi:hypothetical protein